MENLFYYRRLRCFARKHPDFCEGTRTMQGIKLSFVRMTAWSFALFSVFVPAQYAFSKESGLNTVYGNAISSSAFFEITQEEAAGMVRNRSGEGLSGVTILEKTTGKTWKTNADGSFTVAVSSQSSILVFKHIGYVTVEIPASEASAVTMEIENSVLEEIVVTGYGVLKRANLTGAVSNISSNSITARPTPNLQNLLQGRASGLEIVQSSGEPGRDGASISIRGMGSYGASSAPLILVDGVMGSINNLAPQDIESVSVLKDAASASIYGARAANGVILVTTKKGKAGEDRIDYNFNYGISQATVLPELITNSATYMQMYNDALQRNGQPSIYTQDQIDLYRNSTDKNQYPDFDWINYGFRDAPIQSHQIGFSGGDEKTQYNLSLSYLDQQGVLKKYAYERYNGLLDISRKLNDRIRVGTNINFSYQDATAPRLTNDDAILLLYGSAPTIRPFLADGSGRLANKDFVTNGSNNITIEELFATGGQFTKDYNVTAQAFAEIKLLKDLTWNTKLAFRFFNQDAKNRQFPTETFAFQPNANGEHAQVGVGNPFFNGLTQGSRRDLMKTLYSTLQYSKTFGLYHGVSGLFGYEQQDSRSTNLNGARYFLPKDEIMELNGGPALNQTNSGGAAEWAIQSLFGRVNYDFQGKYLFEANIRHDGTSRVIAKNRWGTFGGVSAGWRLSEEHFIKDNVQWLNDLKLRGSYGVLGNQEIGNYPYQDVLSVVAYPFSVGSPTTGARLTALTDKNLKWEKTAITNIGIDLTVFSGLFSANIDWYVKNTTDILARRSDVPTSMGLTAPIVNAGAMENKGWEMELRHQNQVGKVNYGAFFIFSKNENKVTSVLAPNLGTFEVGQPYNTYFLHVWDGIFQSEEEIASSPSQPNSGNVKPGDLKIRDVSGNGTIGPEDRVRFSRYPDFTYSLGLNVDWNQFSLTTFLQGVKGRNILVGQWGFDPFIQGTSPSIKFVDAWRPDNPSNTVPAVYLNGYPGVNGYTSTYSLMDASYLRLKNVMISYAFSEDVLRKIKSKGLSIFVSGDNLYTWTDYEGADPERSGDGRYAQFPQLRIYNIGLSLKF